MRFDPKATPFLPKGIYAAEIAKSEDKTSKTGNEMIEVTLRVWDSAGTPRMVKDWFVQNQPWKLKRLCKALGPSMLAKFESGMVEAHDLLGLSVRAAIDIEEQDGFEPRNAVKGYEASASVPAKPLGAHDGHKPLAEEDIPFDSAPPAE